MPRQYTAYEPDQIDCQALAAALGNDFSVVPMVETVYGIDHIVTVVRCRKLADMADGKVCVQAMVKIPLRTTRSLYVMQYSALLDCWHQLDRGVLAVADTPVMRDWTGRPQTPRRRHKQ
jgi:hypothetical protein